MTAWRLGLLLAAFFAVLLLAPGLVAPQSPFDLDPARALQPPSAAHWFGTDDVGRDVFARVVHGTRVTLGLVTFSLTLAMLVGGGLGVVAGFAGGWFDLAAGRLTDMVQTFPPIIAGVMITGVLGPGAANLVLALAVIYLPNFFRLGRSAALAEAQLTYVEAARAAGFAEPAILLRQVLPNVLPVLVLNFVILFPLALQIEAALGFLGLGVVPPAPDWGAILEQGKNFILVAWWMSLWPGLFVLLSALAMTLLGRGLREKLAS
ncbi:ABC transporter permease [Siccirubricoccus sp. KC 17139]|uniref:ABC transporter permease n=1 Tax=Siccirubricoccus soli TaxID=2899147 RepID=A0ABT1D1K9_9PROT|nr:ABC transporter permease [Siccirubricoccus soli]MCO6415774.1 ABC transporter permease [Siccirubricoccus soli]MCP2681906.1 ABC transporter permease [Siccirubricoccus soli]